MGTDNKTNNSSFNKKAFFVPTRFHWAIQGSARSFVKGILISFLAVFFLHCTSIVAVAEIRDRIVAFVDDYAITLSEVEEQAAKTRTVSPSATDQEVLNTMINRVLLLREARKYKIEAPSDEEIINEYINLKLRAFIRVGEDKIEKFYLDNRENFKGKDLEDSRDEIERYLTEKELNERLKETLKELRKNAYVRVQLEKPKSDR